jgi:hypothetical protein
MKQTFCRIPGPGETRDCIDPWIFVYVRATGEVDACCRGVTIGSLKDATLEEVVNGPAAVELREQVLTGDLPPGCVQCATRGVTTVEKLRKQVEHKLFDSGFEEQEDLRRQVREHGVTRAELLKERKGLREHAKTVDALLADTRQHAANLEAKLKETEEQKGSGGVLLAFRRLAQRLLGRRK